MWAMENNPSAGTNMVTGLIGMLRGLGGFRPGSSNYCQEEVIGDVCGVLFDGEPVELTVDGRLWRGTWRVFRVDS